MNIFCLSVTFSRLVLCGLYKEWFKLFICIASLSCLCTQNLDASIFYPSFSLSTATKINRSIHEQSSIFFSINRIVRVLIAKFNSSNCSSIINNNYDYNKTTSTKNKTSNQSSVLSLSVFYYCLMFFCYLSHFTCRTQRCEETTLRDTARWIL